MSKSDIRNKMKNYVPCEILTLLPSLFPPWWLQLGWGTSVARLFSHRVSCLESHLRFRFRYPVTVQTTSPCSGPTGERSSKIRNIPRYFGQVQEIGDPFTNPLEGIPSRERVRTHRPTRRDFTLLVFLPSSFLEGQSCRSLRGYKGLFRLLFRFPCLTLDRRGLPELSLDLNVLSPTDLSRPCLWRITFLDSRKKIKLQFRYTPKTTVTIYYSGRD